MTNQQWTQELASDEDEYPVAPEFTPPPGADSDHAADGDDACLDSNDGLDSDRRQGEDEDTTVEDQDGAAFDEYDDPVDLDLDLDLDDGDGDDGGEVAEALALGRFDVDSGPAQRRPARYDAKVAAGFGGAALVAIVVTLVAAVAFYGDSAEPKATVAASLADPAAQPPTRTADPRPAAAATGDRPLPYTADAVGSCGPGSTSAQTMAGTDPLSAFKCVRGGGDGQVIEIDLAKTYMITAISLTPGWVGKDASGVSQWSQHRVVSTVQYLFNDTDRTLVTQETNNVHGEAVQPIKRVLASKIRILIRQTSRPPAQPEPGTSPSNNTTGLPIGLPMAPMADPLGGQQGQTDPVDAAFAISSLKIIGHEPL